MEDPIDQALEIIRTQRDPQRAWAEMLTLCRTNSPSRLWDLLPVLDVEKDISEATEWLSCELAKLPDVTGIYLGIDTLNMDDGDGFNLEFGGTADSDVASDGIDWVYERLKYGDHHSILGLYELHAVYSQPQWEKEFSFCDYLLFLAYSGIVLGQAFIRLPTERTLLPAWGFHDGDLFLLGRKTPGNFEFICKC